MSKHRRKLPGRRNTWNAVARVVCALVLVVGMGSCTALRGLRGTNAAKTSEAGPDPEVVLKEASLALDDGRFTAARHALLPMLSSCLTSSAERRAALLLASAELDPSNPHGTPAEAARLAVGVLLDAAPDDSETPVARTLYLVALDRGAPPVARGSRCARPPGAAAPSLPVAPDPTTPERLAALRGALAARDDTLAARADSLAELRARASAADRQVHELEAELERIRQLLRGGAPPPRPPGPGVR